MHNSAMGSQNCTPCVVSQLYDSEASIITSGWRRPANLNRIMHQMLLDAHACLVSSRQSMHSTKTSSSTCSSTRDRLHVWFAAAERGRGGFCCWCAPAKQRIRLIWDVDCACCSMHSEVLTQGCSLYRPGDLSWSNWSRGGEMALWSTVCRLSVKPSNMIQLTNAYRSLLRSPTDPRRRAAAAAAGRHGGRHGRAAAGHTAQHARRRAAASASGACSGGGAPSRSAGVRQEGG